MGPRGPPPIGEERSHQRRGEGRPGCALAERRPAEQARVDLAARWRPPSDEELDVARLARQRRRLGAQGRALKLTNLDKALFPGRPGEAAGHETGAGPILRLRRSSHARPTWPSGRSTCTATRTASGRPGFWHKEIPALRTRVDRPVAQHRSRTRRDRVVRRGRQLAGARMDGQLRRSGAPPVDVDGRRRAPTHLGVHRHRSWSAELLRRRGRRWPGCTGQHSTTSRWPAVPR